MFEVKPKSFHIKFLNHKVFSFNNICDLDPALKILDWKLDQIMLH